MTDSVNLITDAISIALNGEFGDGYTNYTENVKQGLKEPCFFISVSTPPMNFSLGSGISGKISFAYSSSRLTSRI